MPEGKKGGPRETGGRLFQIKVSIQRNSKKRSRAGAGGPAKRKSRKRFMKTLEGKTPSHTIRRSKKTRDTRDGRPAKKTRFPYRSEGETLAM